jgi:hypothetical protein
MVSYNDGKDNIGRDSVNVTNNPLQNIPMSGSRTAAIERIVCRSVYNVPIYDRKKLIGRALMVEAFGGDQLMLLDICIFNNVDRKKGAATDLMKLITGVFSNIVTGSISKAGRSLCIRHGFKPIMAPDGKTELLLYERSLDNAAEKGEKSEGDL